MGQLKNQVKKRPAALFAPTDREENDVKPATLALADNDDSESNKGNKKKDGTRAKEAGCCRHIKPIHAN